MIHEQTGFFVLLHEDFEVREKILAERIRDLYNYY